MSQVPKFINECDVVSIFPMDVECVVSHPSSLDAANGSASLNVIGGTPPYNITWENGDKRFVITNLSVGEYNATVKDYYGDFVVQTTCVLTGETDCSFSVSVSKFLPTPTPTTTPTMTPTSELTPTPTVTPTQTITPTVTPTSSSSSIEFNTSGGDYPSNNNPLQSNWLTGNFIVEGPIQYYVWLYVETGPGWSPSPGSTNQKQTVSVDIKNINGTTSYLNAQAPSNTRVYSFDSIIVSKNTTSDVFFIDQSDLWVAFGGNNDWKSGFAYNTVDDTNSAIDLFPQS